MPMDHALGGRSRTGGLAARAIFLCLALALAEACCPASIAAQSDIPRDRIHFSVAFGGYFLVGVGYTHWFEEHHALEFTAFPFAHPGEGFPFGLRIGHAWTPSNEVWRAKLGGNLTAIISPSRTGWNKITPILALTPGIRYDPDSDFSFRGDLWMSYFLTEQVFAPTAIEIISGWRR